MTIKDTFTSLMDAARQEYSLTHKISFAELTQLIKPNPNIAKGTDDYSGDTWGAYAVQDVDQTFNGLSVKQLFGGAHIGPAITVEAGTYTYSFFVKASEKIGGFVAKLRPYNIMTKQENASGDIWIAGNISDKSWHHVSFTFNNVEAGSYIFIAESWPGNVQVAGQKVEAGPYATPYYTTDNRLITAPEVEATKTN